jgi:N-acetyl-1-D-myo-inositol-2-amino-2-deoxy-alpha-D-glucopyranoside deacetylase
VVDDALRPQFKGKVDAIKSTLATIEALDAEVQKFLVTEITRGKKIVADLEAAFAAEEWSKVVMLWRAGWDVLGGAGRYGDSGMMGLPDNDDPACFWQADVDEAAASLVEVILEVRPQVLVTYDDNGGYGHPDHIQAHRVALRAAELAEGAGWRIPKVYFNRVPRSVAGAAFARLREELPGLPFARSAVVTDVPGVVDDDRVTAEIHGGDGDGAYAAAKAAAMRAHATQVEVAPGERYFALSNDLAQPLFATEYYELVRGEPARRHETDLFAGVAGTAGTEEVA